MTPFGKTGHRDGPIYSTFYLLSSGPFQNERPETDQAFAAEGKIDPHDDSLSFVCEWRNINGSGNTEVSLEILNSLPDRTSRQKNGRNGVTDAILISHCRHSDEPDER
nr:hypothetical protein [uncultured Desulfosarcina sp.]